MILYEESIFSKKHMNLLSDPLNDNNPIITSSGSFTVEENQTAVSTLTASDQDNDNLTFSISGGDSSALEITDSGVITFKENPNFAQNLYY